MLHKNIEVNLQERKSFKGLGKLLQLSKYLLLDKCYQELK
jgi:hypothetical protein